MWSCVADAPIDLIAVPRIPLVDVKAQYAPLIPELKRAFAEVLESGAFILGPNVKAFEREAAEYLGVDDTIGVANGTDAIVIVLDALGIGPGDEVICPSFTFYATAESIARRGATPVFAEIDPRTYNLDPEDVAARITPRTRAIMPVHLFGRPAPLEELASLGAAADRGRRAGVRRARRRAHRHRLDLQLLSDEEPVHARRRRPRRRQRRGARVGACACCGSTARARRSTSSAVGYNSRLDEIHAATLRILLPHLDEWTRLRREAAERYRELGMGEFVTTPDDEPGHVYHLFVSRSSERDRIVEALREAEIGCATYYLPPLHLQPALRYLGYEEGSLPETEKLARENFSVPLWAGVSEEQQERVVEVVRSAVGRRHA